MQNNNMVLPFDLVIFGGTGDLSLRKLIPALYHRDVDGQFPADGRIIAASRSQKTTEEFIAVAEEWAKKFIKAAEFDQEKWDAFKARIVYTPVDAKDAASFQNLNQLMDNAQDKERIYYLSTAPDFFGDICENLHHANLITEKSRVVLEKPLGHDLASANAINERVGRFFPESAIFRIDHYLGKETVQNLLVLRFGNTIFESLWNHTYIDHIQITASEQVGVEGRAGFYDNAGALRDMVQNHLMQLLCIIAMEAPPSLDSDAVRDEKLKVIRSLRSMSKDVLETNVVRGQYTAGAMNGEAVPGYLEEKDVPAESRTETFVAIKAEVNNWRWAGVPFYLRTGKRLSKRQCEIVVQFKSVPHSIFESATNKPANKLVIRLQPDEGVTLELFGKKVGQGMELRPMTLNLSSNESAVKHVPEAYERLLVDAIAGNATLFNRRDELAAAWEWVEPILNQWESSVTRPEPYASGTWGPAASTLLLARDGRLWHEDE